LGKEGFGALGGFGGIRLASWARVKASYEECRGQEELKDSGKPGQSREEQGREGQGRAKEEIEDSAG
jgi:hypothetical protein